MAEDPQPMTLQQRIAALNAAHIGRTPGDVPQPIHKPAPQVPVKRPVIVKQKSVNNPPEQLNGSITQTKVGNQPNPPPLPARKAPPPLPARKASPHSTRRESIESLASAATSEANGAPLGTSRSRSSDRIKAPAWGETELPALPTKGTTTPPRKYSSERPKYINRAPSSSSSIPPVPSLEGRRPSQPSLPPRLPVRQPSRERNGYSQEQEIEDIPPVPSIPASQKLKKSALDFGFNNAQPEQDVIPIPVQTNGTSHKPAGPPPVPVSSKPDLSAIRGTKPKLASSTSVVNGSTTSVADVCLVCRDFTGPDHHATLFPRTQVSSLPNLAQQLTSPFASLTDKARAIFTWLHHNINYDVDNFFGGTVRGSTPQSTLQTGLAVCEGYAALFANLAAYSGLECIVISGHGKGYGYHPLTPNAPIPPYSAGHAWNCVKIDNGEWKLIDATWGAGHVQGKGMPYVRKFTPEFFSMTNEEFGIKHFPGNKEHFFLPGGKRMSWEEYIQINPEYWPAMVEGPTVYTNAKEDYFIGPKTVMPRNRKINVNSGNTTRFQFGLLCPHWTLHRHANKGPPPVFIMSTNGVDGRNKDLVPLEHYSGPNPQSGGDTWIVDIPAKELGAPGQSVTLFAVRSFGDRQDARGLSVREFREGKGRVGMGFTGVAAWDLV